MKRTSLKQHTQSLFLTMMLRSSLVVVFVCCSLSVLISEVVTMSNRAQKKDISTVVCERINGDLRKLLFIERGGGRKCKSTRSDVSDKADKSDKADNLANTDVSVRPFVCMVCDRLIKSYEVQWVKKSKLKKVATTTLRNWNLAMKPDIESYYKYKGRGAEDWMGGGCLMSPYGCFDENSIQHMDYNIISYCTDIVRETSFA